MLPKSDGHLGEGVMRKLPVCKAGLLSTVALAFCLALSFMPQLVFAQTEQTPSEGAAEAPKAPEAEKPADQPAKAEPAKEADAPVKAEAKAADSAKPKEEKKPEPAKPAAEAKPAQKPKEPAKENTTVQLPASVSSLTIASESPITITVSGRKERGDPECRRTPANGDQPHVGRNGALTDREFEMAQNAWVYFERFYKEETGLVNAVGNFPSTTMWDTASYVSALVAAYELCIIEKPEFDRRATKLFGTLRNLQLFKNEAPNKVYHTETGEKVNYANKPGDIGVSALDLGRLLVWLKIVKERYPYLANTVDGIPMRWNFCNIVQEDGRLFGSYVTKEGEPQYVQEGRLGYEEYAANGFALWGFDTSMAMDPRPLEYTSIYDVKVPYDGRDPRVFKNQNYVLTEGYILDGLELGWDLPTDLSGDGMVASHGWRAEFANRIYLVQQRRFEQTGVITARSEHQVDGKPFFVYDAIFADGYAWNTLDPTQEYQPDRAAVAAKAALGMWALWDTPYTDLLFETVADLRQPDRGFYEGIYENGSGFIPLQTANNNGVILAALLYKVQGPILQSLNKNPQVWDLALANTGLRDNKCHPQPMTKVISPVDCSTLPELPAPVPASEFRYCKPMMTETGISAVDCGTEEHQLASPEPQVFLPKQCTNVSRQP